MSRLASVMCDRCGKVKGEANAWLKGTKMCGGYVLAASESFTPPVGDCIVHDFCSEQCALAVQATHLRPVN